MSNEETQVLNENKRNDNSVNTGNVEKNGNVEKKSSGIAEKAAFAVGGFAAGMASSAYAGSSDEAMGEEVIFAEGEKPEVKPEVETLNNDTNVEVDTPETAGEVINTNNDVDTPETAGEVVSTKITVDGPVSAEVTVEGANAAGMKVEVNITSGEEQAEVVTPEVETAEVVTPEVETAEVVTPEVETAEVVTPEVETAEVVTPEVETPIESYIAEGEIRIAQVDDSDSFAEAFADARQQVGPGGAFEWRGNVYNTYYADEWESMSDEQRADFLAQIDDNQVYPAPGGEVIPPNVELVDTPVEDPIKVLEVETVVDDYGNTATMATVEVEGEQAVLFDVDNNGEMDCLIVDANCDNEITADEIIELPDAQIETADLQQMMDAGDTNNYLAYNDDMPDYMNDADISTMA